MNKQIFVTGFILVLIIGILAVIVVGSKNKSQTAVRTEQSVIFYFGNTCPHCAEVETWIKENKIENKITIVKKEVYDNQQNAQELTRAALSCHLPADTIGVPFLYAEDKCFVGTPDVMNYLSQKAGLK